MRIVALDARGLFALEGQDEDLMVHVVQTLACHVDMEIVDVRVSSLLPVKTLSIRMRVKSYGLSVLESLCLFAVRHVERLVFSHEPALFQETVCDETCGYVMLEASESFVNEWNRQMDEIRHLAWTS
jgi:hypothetical protein